MQAKWQDRFNVDGSWHEHLLCPQMVAPAIRNKETVLFAVTYEKMETILQQQKEELAEKLKRKYERQANRIEMKTQKRSRKKK